MTEVLPAAALLGALATLFLLFQALRYRRGWIRTSARLQEQLDAQSRAAPPPPGPADAGMPVPAVAFESFEPRFARTELGPTLASEVCVVAMGDGARGGTSDTEAIALAVFSKEARRLFEFGTATGRTTYVWARNSPPDARITTLTLAPDQVSTYQAAEGDLEGARVHAERESTFSHFVYAGTDVASKITQLYGDSKAFDEGPYVGCCDLIFVDGSHALSYVRSDTEKALRMLRPGGVILWHDYRHPAAEPDTVGVYEYLNALHQTLPLVRLGATCLVAYRAPHGPPAEERPVRERLPEPAARPLAE